ncbi:hypothetical protein L210DRAFT_3640198 [Boletus edulis BED1]|uniref:Uncharacterized protein n=1 Tax=Boletus edulis BED1 TaxID=1328754 RepID=A0AAD4C8D2_BOLED|nr:hypothetical protein L210DRAFT_3640198 [Boletus edulis BED1]
MKRLHFEISEDQEKNRKTLANSGWPGHSGKGKGKQKSSNDEFNMLCVPSEATKASALAAYAEDEMGFGDVRIPSEPPPDIPSTGPSLSMLIQNPSLAGPLCAMQTLPDIRVPTPLQPADQDAAMEEADDGPTFDYSPLPEQITLRIEDRTGHWPDKSIDTSGLQQRLWESHISLEQLTFLPIAFSEAALWSTRIKELDKCYKPDNHPPIPQ